MHIEKLIKKSIGIQVMRPVVARGKMEPHSLNGARIKRCQRKTLYAHKKIRPPGGFSQGLSALPQAFGIPFFRGDQPKRLYQCLGIAKAKVNLEFLW